MNLAAVEAGAQELVLADTLSVASPDTISRLVEKIIKWTEVPLMIHCHNDFGLATACTLAGVQAGATYAHVTVNGLGEKAGNADIAEVAGALATLLGYRHSLNMQMLPQLAELVEKLSDFPLSPQKPIVGSNAFTRESGVVTSQLYTYPPAVEAYEPALFGRETEVVLGKKSGKSSIKYFLNKLGYEMLDDDEIQGLTLKVKDLSLREKRNITEQEFITLLDASFEDLT
jgi:isopropylmalate/homocitrate/citramalate synthase